MKVTADTKWAEFESVDPYITEETRKDLHKAAQDAIRRYGELTIDEFFGLVGGDLSILGMIEEPTVLQMYWMRGFEQFCKELTDATEKLKVPSDPNKEQVYQRGCVELSTQEHMLIFVRAYFGLPSFYEAGKRTMGEYLTARKDEYNKGMMQYNFEQAQKEKFKKR